MDTRIRLAGSGDAKILSDIAYSAKAHWGYPQQWMEVWKPQFNFPPSYFEEYESWTLELDGRLIAFYTLQEKNGNAWIENMWVLPEFIGNGIGRKLFIHAVSRSREIAYSKLQLEADPNAVGFYETMGMYKIGESSYQMNGKPRFLPVMEIML
jgi:GNAT superfamily N-acetyltransferase